MNNEELSEQEAGAKNVPVQQFSHHVSVPSDDGMRVDRVITIERPVAEVYGFWQRLENLPRFMRNLESVEVKDDLHSHWSARTVGGKLVEWDAEIIERRENEMMSWRSTPGSRLGNAGSVWFTPVPGNKGTMVRVQFKYVPPMGKPGAFMTKLFGKDADAQMEEDLGRLKSLLETGQLPPEPESWGQRVVGTTRRAAQATDTFVRENPWKLMALAAAVGVLFGLVVRRRSNGSGLEDED